VRTEAAVLWEYGQDWQIEELELDDPQEGEVLVRLAASGLCHSDEHVRIGDLPLEALPGIGGHEGAGVVERVGRNVTKVREGDHVVLSFIPACGACAWCAAGHQNLCDEGANLTVGLQRDGTSRHHVRGQDARLMCLIGTFSPYTVCSENSAIRIDDDLPLDKAALVGCGVTTGWGTAVYAAGVSAGDTVVVLGIGGVGANALQGAKMAGAARVIAIDPAPFNREQAKRFGATHTFASAAEALVPIQDMTRGLMANSALITVGVTTPTILAEALSLVGKLGVVVLTSLGAVTANQVELGLFELTAWEKRVVGALFGHASPRRDVPKLLDLYRRGQLILDDLVTRTYPLAEINDGYQAMREHQNIRGLITYD
jgi:NDMA-dependent alcohol dehydrogenase